MLLAAFLLAVVVGCGDSGEQTAITSPIEGVDAHDCGPDRIFGISTSTAVKATVLADPAGACDATYSLAAVLTASVDDQCTQLATDEALALCEARVESGVSDDVDRIESVAERDDGGYEIGVETSQGKQYWIVATEGDTHKVVALDDDVLAGVTLDTSFSEEELAAARPVFALYASAPDVSRCEEVVTEDVRFLCDGLVESDPPPPNTLFHASLVSDSCATITVGFEDGSKQWNTERMDGEWLVGVSDDFGDEEAPTCASSP